MPPGVSELHWEVCDFTVSPLVCSLEAMGAMYSLLHAVTNILLGTGEVVYYLLIKSGKHCRFPPEGQELGQPCQAEESVEEIGGRYVLSLSYPVPERTDSGKG